MVKFSGLGQAKLFQLKGGRSLVLEGAFTGIHPSSIDVRRLSWMMASYQEFTLLIFRQLGLHQDVPADLDLDYLPDLETMLRYHHVFICYGTGPHVGDCKRKQSDLFEMNISKDKGKLGSKSKLKIVHSGKPLEPFVPLMEDGSSLVKIPGIDDKLAIGVCESSTEKVIEPPPKDAENIMDILNVELNPTECMEVDKNVVRAFGKVILDKVSRTLFDGLPSLKGDFGSLYATILQRCVNITPLESKGHIDILNAIEVMDVATKASLEKAKAYIKESFKDLKNFQWNP
ncbi:hypothetical protein Cgig2_023278 [Carnegiea gigantea]|uniref:Uncharacterized protein n=1 Tax=Carnegiea gigantea TaxID=171969 RepID=A0A9Q1Q6X7_9CARY|nr:hypothetical protein Cgig2_023278 [Carnegiea gigantea]